MRTIRSSGLALVWPALIVSSCAAHRQPQRVIHNHGVAVSMPGLCREPSPGNAYEYGCFLSAIQPLGAISGPVYWHIYMFPSGAVAEASRTERGMVVQAFDRIWLYAIANKDWRPNGGTHMASIGPFQLKPGVQYTARYMEATFPPRRKTSIHTHSGPEAWYVISGAQCLRTPGRTIVARAGEGTFVPEGPPMVLSSIGSETRRAIFLVLHDSDRPWQTNTSGWQPDRDC